MQVNSFKSEKFSQSLHLSLEVVYQPRVGILVNDCLTHDLLRSVSIPAHNISHRIAPGNVNISYTHVRT